MENTNTNLSHCFYNVHTTASQGHMQQHIAGPVQSHNMMKLDTWCLYLNLGSLRPSPTRAGDSWQKGSDTIRLRLLLGINSSDSSLSARGQWPGSSRLYETRARKHTVADRTNQNTHLPTQTHKLITHAL